MRRSTELRTGTRSPDAEEHPEAERIRFELGIDINAGRARDKSRRIVVISQIPKLVLEVHHAEIEDVILVVINTSAKFINNAVVCLASSIGKIPGPDHKIAVGAEFLIDVVKFGADHERSLLSEIARAPGKARPQRRLSKNESSQAKISAARNTLVPVACLVAAVRWWVRGKDRKSVV